MSERFKSPCPLPTPFQDEILKNLIEECSEVIQRATKMQRFGINEVQPGQTLNNAERLSLEVGNLQYMLSVVRGLGMTIEADCCSGWIKKRAGLAKYIQHEPPPGFYL
jgi:hypothetical protein